MPIEALIKEASSETPDPGRSLKNLQRLPPEFIEAHRKHIETIARLFAYSQFLSDFCIKNPETLATELKNIQIPLSMQNIKREFPSSAKDRKSALKPLRETKKRMLLRITLRDIMGITGFYECMGELSALADALISHALDTGYEIIRERFGDLTEDSLTIISLGKLGAQELNYSSDIDIISVYSAEKGASSGILSPSGVTVNRLGPQEYFSRLTEHVAGLLGMHTEDGMAYRVDMRLRPNGSKGEISMSLDSYSSYYESWGKAWERIALIRARPTAGDAALGGMFLELVEPFVWKRSMDYTDIEEIRGLKRKIDMLFDADDIKRGWGGIREVEFFVNAFQLLYGGEKKNLRSAKLARALDALRIEGLLPEGDSRNLKESYVFLRRLEHILQMKDDLQTHALPQTGDEIEILSKKMRFPSKNEFLSGLRLRRLMTRDMYNSLFGGAGARHEVMEFLDAELTNGSMKDYLAFKGFKDAASALKNLGSLNEQASVGKTVKERSTLRKIIPLFLDLILRSENKDRALRAFVRLMEKIGAHESYTDLLSKRPDTAGIIVSAFEESAYLTRSLLSLDNLEGIFEFPDIRMDYGALGERFLNIVASIPEPMNSIREMKTIEELKTGLLFLRKTFDAERFTRALSMLADTILKAILKRLGARGFAVIGLGRLGARQLNIGSDLDLLFVSENEDAYRLAGNLIKFLSGYTAKGVAYRVDMRLRPDGPKGILVNDVEGYRRYYMQSARPWEIQALLRARPVGGDEGLLGEFHRLKTDAIMSRGGELTGQDMEGMRGRIIREIAKEATGGYDIKSGPGGTGEMEFLVQFLQLRHAPRHPALITQNTFTAMKRLARYGILNTAEFLIEAYGFMSEVETLLRLNEEDTLKHGSETSGTIARFLGIESEDALIRRVEDIRQKLSGITRDIYKRQDI